MTDDKQAAEHPHVKRGNVVMWIFLAIIAYLLVMEHWAHIVPYLPYLLLLLCPFMHFFMHGKHHHGHGGINRNGNHNSQQGDN